MLRWIPYTFVRTVLFFIGGILMGMYWPGAVPEGLAQGFVAGGIVLYFLLVVFKGRHLVNPGWVGLPLIFLFGYLHLLQQTASRHANNLINYHSSISGYKAVVTGFAEEKRASWKMEASVLQIRSAEWLPVEGKMVLYFPRKTDRPPFGYGDVLLVKGAPELTEGPANPGEFDYREYLALRNIYHQHFVREGGALKIGYDPNSSVMAIALEARTWCGAILKRYVHGQREQAIASALVLGVTDGLDNELLNAYASTGTMHILAVSGLHISILYFILLWMLSPLQKLPGGKWVVPIAGILVMWMYAFITGLPPSVLRAVTMFSFLAVARLWARNANVFNTLAVSAFCLLLFDPFLIRSVGFQLSYLAVLGIVYLYPRILVLCEPSSWIMTEVWKMTAVSIAAQAATFSLGLLYFHQFPNLFLLSNLLVVPLSSVVLIMGIAVLGVSFVPVVATFIGFCLGMLIRFLNYIVFALESVPFSLTENIYINAVQCLLLLLFLLAVLALLHYRKFRYAVAASFFIVLYAGVQWWHFSTDVDVTKIVVYKVPGHRAMDLIEGGRSFFLCDPALREDRMAIRYHITPNRMVSGVRKVSEDSPASISLKGCSLLAWRGQTILYISDHNFEAPSVSVDLVIIGNNAVPHPEDVLKSVSFRKAVLDSSNSFAFATRFLKAAQGYHVDVFSVLHQGAFVSTIENHDS
jgi:competence protein ComEC